MERPLPPARGAASITYSFVRNEVFMFGGVSGLTYIDDLRARFRGGSPTSSVWRPNDLNTSMATGALKPSGRAYASMVSLDTGDAVSTPMYLFGGQTSAGTPSDELWKLVILADNIPSWTKVTPPTPATATSWPKPRLLHGMAAIDSTTVLLFGGVDKTGTPLSDTWSWSHATQKWTRRCESCFPATYGFTTVPGRARSGARDMPVVFGGYDVATASYTAAVHQWDNSKARWEVPAIGNALVPTDDSGFVTPTATAGTVSPQARFLGFGFWSPTGNLMVGGGVRTSPQNVDTYINDLWAWQTPGQSGGNRWVREGGTLSLGLPGFRESPAAVLFELTNDGNTSSNGLVFGGITNPNTGQVTDSTRLYRADATTVSLTVGTAASNTAFRLTAAVTNIPTMQAYFMRRRAGTWEPVPGLGCGSVYAPQSTTGSPTCDTLIADNATTDAFAVLVRNEAYHTQLLGTPGRTAPRRWTRSR
ncbi:MAG: hypothetical protein EOO74_07405 [Myxococcales bacterium]|nr:MAG: hypothetical protein EOO74_07405 [Myxococcales bacterium]